MERLPYCRELTSHAGHSWSLLHRNLRPPTVAKTIVQAYINLTIDTAVEGALEETEERFSKDSKSTAFDL